MYSLLGKGFCFAWNNRTFYPLGDRSTLCHLRAGLFSNEIMRFVNDPNLYVCLGNVELIHIILENLRCSIEFIDSRSIFGGRKVNGTWMGLMGLLAEKKADFIPHPFSCLGHRLELIYYDLLLPQLDLVTILSYPKAIIFANPLKIFKTFSPALWWLILLSLIICGVLHKLNDQSAVSGSLYQWALLYVDLFGLSLGHGSVVLRGRQSLMFNPIFAYIAAILVMRQIFSGELTAILLSDDRVIYDHFDQLVEDPDMKLMMQQNSTSHLAFLERYPQAMTRSVLVSFEDLLSIESLDNLTDSNMVIITERLKSNQVQGSMLSRGLHISSEGFLTLLYNYPIRKSLDDDRKHRLAQLFRHVHYFGLDHRIKKDMEINQFRRDYRKNSNMSLQELRALRIRGKELQRISRVDRRQIHNFMTAIYIYIFGVAVAMVTFFIEVFPSQRISNSSRLFPQ